MSQISTHNQPKRTYVWICECTAGECEYATKREAEDGSNSKFCGRFIGIRKSKEMTGDSAND